MRDSSLMTRSFGLPRIPLLLLMRSRGLSEHSGRNIGNTHSISPAGFPGPHRGGTLNSEAIMPLLTLSAEHANEVVVKSSLAVCGMTAPHPAFLRVGAAARLAFQLALRACIAVRRY